MTIDPVLAKDLKKADLRYVNDSMPGIMRKRTGETFAYYGTDEKNITSDVVLNRINELAIPPAWSHVWICPSPTGYLQAIGFDEKNRKQYIYHADWTKISQENKFNKMVFFGEALQVVREKIAKDMALEELERDKIIATVIWLLEHTFIRVGNNEYAEENNSFGLTTLRNRHVKVRGKNIKFEFRGKSGVQQTVRIAHPRIAKIIKDCIELPGYEIFQYLDDKGERHTVDSSDVNNYLKKVTNDDITAKDFRTWGGTVLCAATLYKIGPFMTSDEGKKNISQAVKKVSQHLRNTVPVCRSYYIHPSIFESYQKNTLIPHFADTSKNYSQENTKMTCEEVATLSLLRKYS